MQNLHCAVYNNDYVRFVMCSDGSSSDLPPLSICVMIHLPSTHPHRRRSTDIYSFLSFFFLRVSVTSSMLVILQQWKRCLPSYARAFSLQIHYRISRSLKAGLENKDGQTIFAQLNNKEQIESCGTLLTTTCPF